MSIVLPNYSLEKQSEETFMFIDVAFCPENVAIVRQDHILCMPLSVSMLSIVTLLYKKNRFRFSDLTFAILIPLIYISASDIVNPNRVS